MCPFFQACSDATYITSTGYKRMKICFWTKDSEEGSIRKGGVGKILKFWKLTENALKWILLKMKLQQKDSKLFQSSML